MTEQRQQSAKLVETNKALAAGLASVVTALFTSKLGVAGTLIGTALTAITITLVAAILKAQIERAQTKLAGLPSTVRGRLSTQQVRSPGGSSTDPNPEPPPPPPEPRAGRSASFVERLRSIPSFLRGLSPAARRRILLSGVLAGVVATVIGLSIITFTEVVAGKPISSLVSTQGGPTGETGPRTSVGSLFGGSRGTDPQNRSQQYAPQDAPAGGDQYQEDQPQQPGAGGDQYQEDQPQQPADPALEPGGTPQDETPPQQQPGAEPAPGAEEPEASPDQ